MFQFLSNMPLEEARRGYLERLKAEGLAPRPERIPVGEACGRVTFAPVYARICAPHYHASAMDGIALRAELSFGAGETTPVRLSPEQYIPVDTGDPLPEGCDAVVMIEEVVSEADGHVRLYSPAAPWQHIRQIGEDICAGEMIAAAGVRLGPAAIGAMIAGGVLELEVMKKPLVGIIPTGDEIVPPTDEPKPGDILEFNSSIFSAMIEQWGGEARVYPIAPDSPGLMSRALELAACECDIVLLNAGSSAGRDDYAARTISGLGSIFCHGVAIKPGKPAILGHIGAKPVIGVPGYPVSGIIVTEQFLKPILEYCGGLAPEAAEYAEATLARPVVSGLKYREFVRVRMGRVGGRLIAAPLNRGAGVVSSFMKADGILEIPQGLEGCEAGAPVSVRLLRPRAELDNTLVVTGSHDPLLDELANLMHLAAPAAYMSSSHVGSMGGIMAVRRGEAHAAGIHLLDEADGSYNISYLKKYFPNGGVKLVECVGRSQGLMVAAGNPLGLSSVSGLTRRGLRYVNRQKGSGTRILFDYLCRKHGLEPGGIYGYEREELTHTSVAAQIASGSADAGMGIYSAAKMYGLDFIPICTEQYDLLIPDHAWDSPLVRLLLDTLKSEAFFARLDQMGGYSIENPGALRYEP
ncbi:MAG: molybdopterin biosynthesis protein [Clostridia bacterium]|nr:molybdopterin biosynthesis protein [Clostridia bacterium]